MMKFFSPASNSNTTSNNKNSTDLTDLNAGHFWVAKDGTKYYLNLTDLKDYYLGNKTLKEIKVWDGSQYVQNQSVFSGFEKYAQNTSFAGLVNHVTKTNKSDFEGGHAWVQVLTPDTKSGHNYNTYCITGDVSKLFTHSDKKDIEIFAKNIIELFEQSKKQIGIETFDHNHQRVSRYLYTLSRLAAFVPKLWNTFIQTHGEWIRKQDSYKDHYKKSVEFGNNASKESSKNSVPITNQALVQATIPQLNQPINSSSLQQIDIKGSGELNKANEQKQTQPIANANKQKKGNPVLINASVKTTKAVEEQKPLNRSNSHLSLSDIHLDSNEVHPSKLNDGSRPQSIPNAKIQLPTYAPPEFFNHAINHVVNKIKERILPSINKDDASIKRYKDTITTLQSNSASNYDKYHGMKAISPNAEYLFQNKFEFKVAESYNHWGQIRISVGYEADGTNNFASTEASALQTILKGQGIDVFNADNPAYNNCIYINPKDLEKAWGVLQNKDLSPYSANHDAYGKAAKSAFGSVIERLNTLNSPSKNANADQAASPHRL